MKTLTAIFVNLMLSIVLACPAFAQNESGKLEGNWLATLDVGGTKLRLILKIQKTADGYTAKFDSVDQAATDLPVDSVSLNGHKMSFVAGQFGMSYEGTLNDKGDEITGTFKQGAGSTTMIFTRTGAVPTLNRPQDPKKPYPYNEEEVSYRNVKDNVKLAGALTLPRTPGPHPAVILISGSGPQDRNETVAGHRPFLVLSDHFTRNGIAVLRVDDRGAGGSDLGSLSATSENYAEDVLAGIQFLKGRKEINARKIGLIGHSEGGMIAPMVAARSRDIAFIVLLAGLGQRGEDVIYTQTELLHRASGTDPETIASALVLTRAILGVVKAESDDKLIEDSVNAAITKHTAAMNESQRKAFEPIAASVRASMAIYKLPWFRYFVRFDPAPTLKKVRIPVLALNGELDLQVAWKENLDLIAAALKSGKNKDYTVKAFPRLNHLFQTSKTGLISEYGQIEETTSPEVLKTISDWIIKRTK